MPVDVFVELVIHPQRLVEALALDQAGMLGGDFRQVVGVFLGQLEGGLGGALHLERAADQVGFLDLVETELRSARGGLGNDGDQVLVR